MFFPIVAIIGILSPLAILTILWYLLWPKRPSLPIPKLPGVFGLTLPPIERLHLWLDEVRHMIRVPMCPTTIN
jgi:hypothetical protein